MSNDSADTSPCNVMCGVTRVSGVAVMLSLITS